MTTRFVKASGGCSAPPGKDAQAAQAAWQQAKAYLADGRHFAKGSMAPKIEACIWFLERGGREAVITDPANLRNAVRGKAGTHIVKDEQQP